MAYSVVGEIIRTEGLSKKYGDRLALDSVNLHVQRGEIYGLLGPNGAGKSTLMALLQGLLKPTSGQTYLFGELVKGRKPENLLRMGVMGEVQYFYDEMTAREYLEFFAGLLCVRDKHRRITEILDRLGLGPYQNYALGTYSHGMRQKLALGRSLLHEPELLLLDEPVSGLDPHGVRLVRELLLELRARGSTIFISSHVLSEVERVADRVGILCKGRLLVEGPVEALNERTGERLYLDIEIDAASSKVDALLSNLPYVISLERSGEMITLELEGSEDYRLDIAQLLRDAGALVVGMTSRRPSLEETFITLTDGNLEQVVKMVGP